MFFMLTLVPIRMLMQQLHFQKGPFYRLEAEENAGVFFVVVYLFLSFI